MIYKKAKKLIRIIKKGKNIYTLRILTKSRKRKVIQIAGSPQIVSLPKKWTTQYNVKKGDELDVAEDGNKLIISTDRKIEPGSITVDVSELDRDSIMFFLRALYKRGYDEIIIQFSKQDCDNFRVGKKEKIMDVVKQEVSRLNGVEIFTQKENSCTIKTISEDTIKIFDIMLRRTFLLVTETIADFAEGYETGNEALLVTIQGKHDAVTKFVNYCQRVLNRVGYSGHQKAGVLYHILDVIDALLDFVKYNARLLLKKKLKTSKEGVEICRGIQASFNGFYELYYAFSLRKVAEVNKMRYRIIAKIEEAQNSLQKGELVILSNMEQVLEHILNLVNARVALEY